MTGCTFGTNTASSNGGGMYCSGASPSISGCTFTSNSASGVGGGLYADTFSGSIDGNTFTGNTAGNGAGLYLSGSSNGSVSGNTVTGNTANTSSGNGGGIYAYSNSSWTISDNAISGNSAYNGAGIYCDSYYGSLALYNNTLWANIATNNAGGIYLSNPGGTMTCVNNTIAGNFCANGGAGIYVYTYYSTSTVVDNNTVAFNASGIAVSDVNGAAPTLDNNCVYGNDANAYLGVADPTGTNGNIAANPLLANMAAGNLHIQPESPCLGTGDSAAVSGISTDADGNPRITGTTVDIGAYEESDNETIWPGPAAAKVVYVSPAGSDSNSGLDWADAKLTLGAGIGAASPGDQVWAAAGTYEELVTLKNRVAVYGGFAGNETLLSQRNWTTHLTTIDANFAGTAVTAPVGCFAGTDIDGFEIIYGQANSTTGDCGGGVYCTTGSVTVANCTFLDDSATNGGGIYLTYSPSVVTGDSLGYCSASNNGGGLWCGNAGATVSNSSFSSNSAPYGGGIYLSSSSSTVTGCTFGTNTASSNGGGMYCTGASPSISGCTFTSNNGGGGGGLYADTFSGSIDGNTFTGNTAGNGAGLYLSGSSNGSVSGNTVTGNTANTSSGNGGGIYAYSNSSWTISDNAISGNSAYNGAGIYCGSYYGSLALYNNTLWANIATNNAGGIYLSNPGGTTTCVNNTIAGNFCANGGAGIYVYTYYSTSTVVDNNTVAFNASGIAVSDVNGTAPTLDNNCVYGNDANAYLGVANQTGINGNIAANPLLANIAAGNLHIQPASPCLGAGNVEAVAGISTDADGNPRITGTTVDIGAYEESDNETIWPGPPAAKVVYVRTTGNDSNSGLTWALAKKTIGAAISAASPGDQVWVMAGTYVGLINLKKHVAVYGGFAGNETVLTQRNWTTNVTTINANLLGTAVTAPVGCFGGTDIDGFNIRNGQATSTTNNCGGAIYCQTGSVTVANCTLRNNSAATAGGGIYLTNSPSTITGDSIINCSAGSGGGLWCGNAGATVSNSSFSSNSAPYGGGIYLSSSSSTVTGCTFGTNTASSNGGGMYCTGASPSISGCTFTSNSASGVGGGLYADTFSGSIDGNTFTGNTAGNGAGLYLSGSSNGSVSGNTVTGNTANTSSGNGGGIYAYSNSSWTISDNAIAGNSAYNGAGIYCSCWGGTSALYNNTLWANIATNNAGGIYLSNPYGTMTCVNNTIADNFCANGGAGIYVYTYYSSSTIIDNNIVAFNASGIAVSDVNGAAPTLDNNCVYPDDANAYLGVANQTGINGNIAANPLLANIAAGNLHIQPASPCLGAGNVEAVLGILTDADGNPRMTGIKVDIGAYEESDNETSWQGPAASRTLYVSATGNDANSGLSWAQAKQTIQAAINTANANDVVWVAQGTYSQSITLKKRVAVYGGFAGTETLLGQRNWSANVTTISGGNSGIAVTGAVGGFADTILDGFTVTGGQSSGDGGGFYCYSGAVQIANDTFTGNSAVHGAGLYLDYSPSTLTNDLFQGNAASSYGGGMWCGDTGATISGCAFTGNVAPYGGGIWLSNSSSTVAGCTFSTNTGSSNGGGMYLTGASPSISGSTFTSNNAGNVGGGIYVISFSGSISGNTFTGNTAQNGAGLYLDYYSSGSVSGNTITGNTANTSSGNGGGIYTNNGGGSWTISSNYVSGNSAANGERHVPRLGRQHFHCIR